MRLPIYYKCNKCEGQFPREDYNMKIELCDSCYTIVKKERALTVAAPELLKALKELRKQIFAHHKMNVKKDYSLLVADAAASKIIHKAEGGCNA